MDPAGAPDGDVGSPGRARCEECALYPHGANRIARHRRPSHLGRAVVVAVTVALLTGGAAYAGGLVIVEVHRAGTTSGPQPAPEGSTDPLTPDRSPEDGSATPSERASSAPSASVSPAAPAAPAVPDIRAPSGTGPAAPTPGRATTAPPAPATPQDRVVALVNQERSRAGCAPLAVDARLARAASAHSADMAANGYFSHTSPDGSGPGERVTRAGYRWSGVGENIAKGQPDPESVMRAWMNSAGHRANIVNCRYRHIGVGLAFDDRSPVWTQDFATPLA